MSEWLGEALQMLLDQFESGMPLKNKIMPGKKKTNYISYEIERLNKYIKQLTTFLDKNPPDKAEDRLEVIDGPRGPVVKIISKKEEQIKLFMEMLQKLPPVLEDLNRLRKGAEGEEEIDVRGGHGLPGFMTSSENKEEYRNNEKVDISEEGFDDDEPVDVEAEEVEGSQEAPASLGLLQGIATDFYNLQQEDEAPEEEAEEEEIEDEDPEWDDED